MIERQHIHRGRRKARKNLLRQVESKFEWRLRNATRNWFADHRQDPRRFLWPLQEASGWLSWREPMTEPLLFRHSWVHTYWSILHTDSGPGNYVGTSDVGLQLDPFNFRLHILAPFFHHYGIMVPA